jgi:hypothetical protein
MRAARRALAFAALAAGLAAAPAAAQAVPDLPYAPALQPLPAELVPPAATTPSVELSARGGRPVWLLPAAGLVAGAVLYPMLVDGHCEDCTIYIPEPAVGAMIGLMGGIVLEVSLRLLSGDLPTASLPPATHEPQAP